MSALSNVMTVDVEEWFTVQNLDERISRNQWSAQTSRADRQTRVLLDLFDRHGVKATFFVLGWVAERQPRLIQEIHARGHEIAAHSYWHRLVYEMTRDEFRADLRRVRSLLEDLTGTAVRGYRAPTYSITARSLWAHEVLIEEGFAYSSSIFPIAHDRYGLPDFPRFAVPVIRGAGSLIELPITTIRLAGQNLPIAGGGYLRLLPARVAARAIAWVNERERQPAVVYVHPWEIDPGIPRYRQGILRDARSYIGLGSMIDKLDLLLRSLPFTRADEALGLRVESVPPRRKAA